MRHAKSDWSVKVADHQRPLNSRGRKSAGRMGQLLTQIGMMPDLVVTSTAIRAVATAKLAAEAGRWNCPISETDTFYQTSAQAVVKELRGLSSKVGTCLVVGHDTTCSGVVEMLTGASAAMKTATVAVIDNGSNWSRLGHSRCQLVALLQPRHFLR